MTPIDGNIFFRIDRLAFALPFIHAGITGVWIAKICFKFPAKFFELLLPAVRHIAEYLVRHFPPQKLAPLLVGAQIISRIIAFAEILA